MNEVNKPIAMIIKETKANLINVCNESGLSPIILDLIVQGIYSEIHSLAERQATQEESAYMEAMKNKDITNDNSSDGDVDEPK